MVRVVYSCWPQDFRAAGLKEAGLYVVSFVRS